jgi:hypothetical protein
MIGSLTSVLVGAAVLLLSALTSGTALARETQERPMSVEGRALPLLAARLKGSGVSCRSLAGPGGVRHKLRLLALKMRLGERVAVRGGIGLARLGLAHVPDARQDGLAAAGSVTFSIWEGTHLALDVSASALRAGYAGHGVSDGTILLALRAL